MTWWNRIWNSLFGRRLQKNIRQELETHLAMLEDAARAEGLSGSDARAEARKRFGSLAAQADQVRDVNSSILLNEITNDIRYSFRQMRRHPGFTAVAVVIIALGISSVTTIFSLVDAVLFHSLPYKDVSRLVYLWTPNTQFAAANIPQEIGPNEPDALDWQARSHSFSSMAMIQQHAFNLTRSNATVRTEGAIVSDAFFRTLGTQPKLGRAFDSSDSKGRNGHVAVISDGLWRSLFAGNVNAIGRTIYLDREQYEVIGIMPEGFGYPFDSDIPYGASHYGGTDVWVPLIVSAAARSDRSNPQSADAMIGRLRDGTTTRLAELELNSIEKGLNQLYPPEMRGYKVLVRPLRDTIIGPVQVLLWILLGAVALVLLIACGNVSNLLLARATARAEEIAIRVSLGAGRSRLIRQILTESIVLSLGGCFIGVMLSFLAVRLLRHMNPGDIPNFDAAALNWPVLLVSIVVAVFSGVLFGLVPALIASRANLNQELRKGGSKGALSPSRFAGQTLIAAEVGMSFTLLIGAGLLILSYLHLQAENPGFLRSTLTMNLQLDERYSKPEQRRALFLSYLARLRQTPGVLQAGAGSDIPLDNSESLSDIEVEGFGKPKGLIDARTITSGYLAAFGMNMLAGSPFNDRDMKLNSKAIIVNQAFAKAFMAGRDPLAVKIRSGSNLEARPWATVVGVVGNRKHSKLEEKPRPEYYQPYTPAFDTGDLHFAIRSILPASQVASLARITLRKLDPELALDDVRTMEERMAEANARRRFQTILLSAFGVLAILLALGGIYGVLSYSVRQRTKEMGLRMALGASRIDIMTNVLKQGLSAVAVGLVLGVITSLSLVGFIRSWLYGVASDDPLAYLLLTMLVLLVAAVACLIPASNAMRVDPAVAIRNE